MSEIPVIHNPFTVNDPNSWTFPDADQAAADFGLVKSLETEANKLGRILLTTRHKGDETCGICFETTRNTNAEVTPCGHFFHAKCLVQWKDTKMRDTCPSCRGEMFPHGRQPSHPMMLEWADIHAANFLVQLGVQPADVRPVLSLPEPPFSFAEAYDVCDYPITYHISPDGGVNLRLLSSICSWVQAMGMRVSRVDDVAQNVRLGGSARRPGGMEVIVREDPARDRYVHVHALAMAYPARNATGRDLLSTVRPTTEGLPLATVDMYGHDVWSVNALIAQTACFILACESSAVMRQFTHDDGLGFGDPAEAAGRFPDTVRQNIAVEFDIDALVQAVNDTVMSNMNVNRGYESEEVEEDEYEEEYDGMDSL
jgi:hypothetical protein